MVSVGEAPPALPLPTAEGGDDVPHQATAADDDAPPAPSTADEAEEEEVTLLSIIQSASQIADPQQRDLALLDALRTCRHELEAAGAESDSTKLRLEEARETFDCAAKLLTGVMPSSLGMDGNTAKRPPAVGDNVDTKQYWKRSKATKNSSSSSSLEDENKQQQQVGDTNEVVEIPTAEPIPIPTNPISIPAHHTSFNPSTLISVDGDTTIMSEADISNHRNNFYQKLLGIPASEVETYTPKVSQANLRSKAQLDEGVHIVQHWDTGADGLDAAAFRSKHKTWYTRMKPANHHLGRRTGIHVRTLPSKTEGNEGQDGVQQEEGENFLCRYSKDGTKSILYLSTSQLYDALFEIHVLEHNHLRGRDAVKSRVNELYANVPDLQVKYFLETCPVCLRREECGCCSRECCCWGC